MQKSLEQAAGERLIGDLDSGNQMIQWKAGGPGRGCKDMDPATEVSHKTPFTRGADENTQDSAKRNQKRGWSP